MIFQRSRNVVYWFCALYDFGSIFLLILTCYLNKTLLKFKLRSK